jgi:hypothetical protein
MSSSDFALTTLRPLIVSPDRKKPRRSFPCLFHANFSTHVISTANPLLEKAAGPS